MLSSEECNQLFFSFSLQLRSIRTFVCTGPPNVQFRDNVNTLATFRRPAVVAKGKSGNVNLSLSSP